MNSISFATSGSQNNLKSSPITRSRSIWLHPMALFVATWCGVAFLYSLHLSDLLIFKDKEVQNLVLEILLPFLVTAIGSTALLKVLSRSFATSRIRSSWSPDQTERRLVYLFRFWMLATCFEIIVSGGVPLFWLLRGIPKTYFDFGIPSIHGLLNSLLQAVALVRMAMFALTGKKKHLWVPTFVLVWSVVVVTRNMMIVVILEAAIATLSFRRVRGSTIIRLAATIMILILSFGAIGDLRSGADHFRALAQPTANYPDWMPSGVLWGYIYLTTPVNNLLYTMDTVRPIRDVRCPNTTALLFPTVIRRLIYGSQSMEAESGELVTQAFNVSTAFTSPYEDWGPIGIIAYSSFIAAVAVFYWNRNTLRDSLIYAVLGQCLFLTVFFNHFFYLPVITQVVWLHLIFTQRKYRLGPSRRFANLSARSAAAPA